MTTSVATVQAWQALDSRGRPTVACRVTLSDGADGTAIVPSGASAGSHEALELRDGGFAYEGRGVDIAVGNVRGPLADAVVGVRPEHVDQVLRDSDDSVRFLRHGANAVLSVSLATALAAAKSAGVSLGRHLSGPGVLELPMPMVNVISGGAHAGGVLDVQDFLVQPTGASTFREAIEWCVRVRETATRIATARGFHAARLAADEGGLGIALESNRTALALLTEAIQESGLRPGVDATIAIDVAATELVTPGGYAFASENRTLDSTALIDELEAWCDDFPIVSIEDPLGEDDWDGWQHITERLGDRIQLVGDDLFVTQADRLRRGIDGNAANSCLVKVNQNGLLAGAKETLDLARNHGYSTVVSARSGDTEDSWLADLAVGWHAGQIKVGSTQRGERTAKWNRLLELEATETCRLSGSTAPNNHHE